MSNVIKFQRAIPTMTVESDLVPYAALASPKPPALVTLDEVIGFMETQPDAFLSVLLLGVDRGAIDDELLEKTTKIALARKR